MPKDIVILFDGTGNAVEKNQTNILKLYRTLKKDESQIVLYIPGVGTFGGDDWWSELSRRVLHVFGLATGWGLDRAILEGYDFLAEHYEEGKPDEDDAEDGDGERQTERDRIWLFGFSRGAYTARALAGFVNSIGLVDRRQKSIARHALTAYKRHGDVFEGLRAYERTFRMRRPPIHFLGLFDTVSTIIAPRPDRIIPQLHELPFTSKNPSVRCVRHALAIDEHRALFRCTLWKEGEPYHKGPFDNGNGVPQAVEQVWFAGVHADIGGGYHEEESGLAKIPLRWMIDAVKAEPDALRFVTQTVSQIVEGKPRKGSSLNYAKPDPLAKLHNSMNFGWAITEFFPARLSPVSWPKRPKLGKFFLPLFSPRRIPSGAAVHASVAERQAGDPTYTPENLPPGAP